MSGDGDLENLILHTIERWWAGRYTERHGLVTSYDPDKYLAKVTFMPEGQESGWIPIETGHVGNGFGIAIGLTPGDGKRTGDQVIVRYQEGDIESGKIVQRVHSDQDKPPKVQSGELVLWTRFTKTAKDKSGLSDDTELSGQSTDQKDGQKGSGQQIFFKNDGSITIQDGAGSTIYMDGKGNRTDTMQTHTANIKEDSKVTIDGARTLQIKKSDTVKVSQDRSVTVNGSRTDKVSSAWNAVASSGIWSWLTSGQDLND